MRTPPVRSVQAQQQGRLPVRRPRQRCALRRPLAWRGIRAARSMDAGVKKGGAHALAHRQRKVIHRGGHRVEDPRPVGCADGDDRVRGVLQWGAANYHGKEGAKTGGVGDIAARNDGGGGGGRRIFWGGPGRALRGVAPGCAPTWRQFLWRGCCPLLAPRRPTMLRPEARALRRAPAEAPGLPDCTFCGTTRSAHIAQRRPARHAAHTARSARDAAPSLLHAAGRSPGRWPASGAGLNRS